MKHEKSCGAVVFRQHNGTEQTLLIRHRNSSAWSFPKGHMERGESERQTAMREIGEETGVNDLRLDTRFRRTLEYYAKANVKKQVVFFVGFAADKDHPLSVRDDVVQEAKWVEVSLAPDMLAFENHRTLFASALQYYRSRQKAE